MRVKNQVLQDLVVVLSLAVVSVSLDVAVVITVGNRRASFRFGVLAALFIASCDVVDGAVVVAVVVVVTA